MNEKKIEILAPAGSYESLKAAICGGADAVYLGGSRFGARAYADNLSQEHLLEAIDYVHLHGRKIYMTVNTLLKDGEIEELYEYLLPYYKQGLDAVIVQDVGVFDYVKHHFPDLPIHVSTQMTVTNEAGAAFFKEKGAERVVPARELSLEEIRKMKQETGLEIECFVHGAICYCYSGQCLLSSMIGGRSGNRGQCAQPCRLPYSIGKGKPQDILSLKDMCTIEMIPDLVDAGIDSFKIEGRMKQPEYVYTVVSMYRKYVDRYLQYGRKSYVVSKDDIKQLQGIYRRRGYCEGYYKQHNGKNMISLKRPELSDENKIIPEYKLQEKINGKLILSEGKYARLSLGYKERFVEVEGEMVQSALKQPLDIERVSKQMRKTGNTQFVFDEFDVEIEGNVFLPMQALNELRRMGIARLEEVILHGYRRENEKRGDALPEVMSDHICQKENLLTVSVAEYEQLKVAIADETVGKIYVDSNLAFEETMENLLRKKRQNCKVYVAMPYIFREKTIAKFEKLYQKLVINYDGVLLRNWEGYHWLKRRAYDGEMISDYNLYVFNKYSKAFFAQTDLLHYTAPVELHYQELKRLGIQDAELIVYGYQPVMFSAGCVRKNTGQCSGQDGLLYLTDRYQKKFAVKNFCKYCYNVIYNSSPLVLLSQRDEVRALNPYGIRLDFAMESSEEMRKILTLYREGFLYGRDVEMPEMDYTRGHFKRGVK